MIILVTETTFYKPIPNFHNYSISKDGKVISYKRNKPRIIGNYKNTRGYEYVILFRDGKKPKQMLISRLVMITHGQKQPKDKPLIRHINGNKLDNRLENLAWCDTAENMADRKIHGTNHWSILTQKGDEFFRKEYLSNSSYELSKKYNTTAKNVSRIFKLRGFNCDGRTGFNKLHNKKKNIKRKYNRNDIPLPEYYKNIFEMRYGIGNNEPKTLKYIGNEFGYTGERIRQICNEVEEQVKLRRT